MEKIMPTLENDKEYKFGGYAYEKPDPRDFKYEEYKESIYYHIGNAPVDFDDDDQSFDYEGNGEMGRIVAKLTLNDIEWGQFRGKYESGYLSAFQLYEGADLSALEDIKFGDSFNLKDLLNIFTLGVLNWVDGGSLMDVFNTGTQIASSVGSCVAGGVVSSVAGAGISIAVNAAMQVTKYGIDTGMSYLETKQATVGYSEEEKQKALNNWGIGRAFGAISTANSIGISAAGSFITSGVTNVVGSAVLNNLWSTGMNQLSGYVTDLGQSFVYAGINTYENGGSYGDNLSKQLLSRFTPGRFVSDQINIGIGAATAAATSGITQGIMKAKYGDLANATNTAMYKDHISKVSAFTNRGIGMATDLMSEMFYTASSTIGGKLDQAIMGEYYNADKYNYHINPVQYTNNAFSMLGYGMAISDTLKKDYQITSSSWRDGNYGKDYAFMNATKLVGEYYGDDAMKTRLAQVYAGTASWSLGDIAGDAVTDIINGKISTIFDSSLAGTDMNSILYGSVVGQHEAYRDAISDKYNEIETVRAVLAHFEMASKLSAVFGKDFYTGTALEGDLKAYENGGVMALIARAINDYNDEADSFLVFDINGDKYQNGGDFWNIMLGGSLTPQEAAQKTLEAKMAKFDKYKEDKYKEYLVEAISNNTNPITREEYLKTIKIEDYNTDLANALKNPSSADSKRFLEKYNYDRYSSYSLGGYGCKMFTALYFAQVISGKNIDPAEMNKYATENDVYIGYYKNLLGGKEFVELIDAFTNSGGDLFDINIYNINKEQLKNLKKDDSIENNPFNKLLEAIKSNDPSMLHVRANGHSMGVTGIDWKKDSKGNIIGIEKIYTTGANPWKDRGLGKDIDARLSRTVYDISKIESLDIIGVKINPKYIDSTYEKLFYNIFPTILRDKYESEYFKTIKM